jgi:hypothetical protein
MSHFARHELCWNDSQRRLPRSLLRPPSKAELEAHGPRRNVPGVVRGGVHHPRAAAQAGRGSDGREVINALTVKSMKTNTSAQLREAWPDHASFFDMQHARGAAPNDVSRQVCRALPIVEPP